MRRIVSASLTLRKVLKTATYGLMHLTVAVGVAYCLTGSIAIALSIGLLEPFVQTFFYNLHEHLWDAACRKDGTALPAVNTVNSSVSA